jgi:hypothetical protein
MFADPVMQRRRPAEKPPGRSRPCDEPASCVRAPNPPTRRPPEQLLKHLKATPMPGIYVLLDFHPYLKDPVNVRLLKDIAQGYDRVARTVVLMSYEVTLPEELQQFSARLHLALPTTNRPLRSSPMSAVCRICGTGWPAASRRSTALPRNWIRPKACSCWGCRVAARVWPRALRALGRCNREGACGRRRRQRRVAAGARHISHLARRAAFTHLRRRDGK